MAGGDYILAGGFWSDWIPCFVDLPDLARFLKDWLKEELVVGHSLDADFNHDGEVNLKDYNIFCSYWMQYCHDSWLSW